MLDPRAADLLDRVWQEHADPACWIFTSKGLKFGDLFMVMTLMEAFRRRQASDLKLKMLAISEGHRAILRLFPGIFDEIHLVPALTDVPRKMFLLWCQERQVDRFAPGNMLYLHPSYYTHGPFDLMVSPTNPPLTFIDLCKIGLRLPSQTALGDPTVSEAARRDAALLASACGVIIGRGLVLFPYAQSSPQDVRPHFAALAAAATAAGFSVVTSVAGDEAPIEGTTPVRVPFDLLSAFCELAGAVVTLRSGIADIVGGAGCRKFVLYASQPELRNYSIIDMGTAQSADEFVLRCDAVAPRAFADDLLPRLIAPRPITAQLQDIPGFVRGYFQQIDSWDGKTTMAGPDLFPVRHLRATRGLVLGEGWADLEPWGVWSLGTRASVFVKNPFPDEPTRRPGSTGKTEIEITARGAVSRAQPRLEVRVTLGDAMAQTVFEPESRTQRLLVEVPAALTTAPAWRLDVGIADPRSPFELSDGTVPDRRRLGIGLEGFSIRPHRPVTAGVMTPA